MACTVTDVSAVRCSLDPLTQVSSSSRSINLTAMRLKLRDKQRSWRWGPANGVLYSRASFWDGKAGNYIGLISNASLESDIRVGTAIFYPRDENCESTVPRNRKWGMWFV